MGSFADGLSFRAKTGRLLRLLCVHHIRHVLSIALISHVANGGICEPRKIKVERKITGEVDNKILKVKRRSEY